ncbi:hypothetical protein AB4Z35_27050 [Pseudomonas sp. KB_15]|uniref:hypothetical protein n=1 Tax=Pseudomonas sp. KB_15 TaxID=3233035 RepID=UPI003F974814
MKLNSLLVLLTLWVPKAWCSNGPAAARVNGGEVSRLRPVQTLPLSKARGYA